MENCRKNIICVYDIGGVTCRICDAAYDGKSESELERVRVEIKHASGDMLADWISVKGSSDRPKKT